MPPTKRPRDDGAATPNPSAAATSPVPLAELSEDFQRLAAACVMVAPRSYCPHSGFTVGAALLHPDGTITTGCNWENCTFQATCAERCAIVAANAQGQRLVTAVAVFGASTIPGVEAYDDMICAPCGLCRQMLLEVSQLSRCDMDVVMVTNNKAKAQVVKLSTLLPMSFGPINIMTPESFNKWRKPLPVAQSPLKPHNGVSLSQGGSPKKSQPQHKK